MKCVLVLTVLATTAVAEGWAWSRIPTKGGPSPRRQVGITFDPVRKQTVIFGGVVRKDLKCLGDTWSFDGTNWVRGGDGPPPRQNAALAFDAVRGRVLLFGGTCGEQYYNDLWEFDGRAWTEVKTEQSPDAGLTFSFLYEPSTKAMVLLLRDSERLRAEVWRLRGDKWSLESKFSECLRDAHASWSSEEVLMLKTDRPRSVTSHSTDCTRRGGGPMPKGYSSFEVVWRGSGSRAVGVTSQLSSGWEWSGVVKPLTFKNAPPARLAAGFVWDSQRLLMFGGHLVGKATLPGMAAGEFSNELWALTP